MLEMQTDVEVQLKTLKQMNLIQGEGDEAGVGQARY